MWTLEPPHIEDQSAFGKKAASVLEDLYSREDIGFLNLIARKNELLEIQKLAEQKKQQYSNIAILGIGGSALGTLALFEACRPEWLQSQRILFFDNVDAVSFYKKLESIEKPLETLWVLISKSGSTIETLTQADCVDQFLKEKYQTNLAEHSVVITEKKSSDLYDWAVANEVSVLGVPLDVGGRFSVLTAVGLFPAAFAGLSITDLLWGAEKAKTSQDFLVPLFCHYWSSLQASAHAAYFFSYADQLYSFGLWIEQLWAESLGKKNKTNGDKAPAVAMPIACRGATDQHSVLQQVAHGVQQKSVTFLRVGSSEKSAPALKQASFKSTQILVGQSIGHLLKAEAMATAQALREENIPTVNLLTEALNEKSIGFLFLSYEIIVAGLGLGLGLNPFDQPGVERGKVLARELLAQVKV